MQLLIPAGGGISVHALHAPVAQHRTDYSRPSNMPSEDRRNPADSRSEPHRQNAIRTNKSRVGAPGMDFEGGSELRRRRRRCRSRYCETRTTVGAEERRSLRWPFFSSF
ncbi:hypothetical protein Zmor_012514 [Zophobas morio]|uniref:Uncharacterized protein n=1 Tax=Zophobas morio TaxID=2755281 RepID=A0AA38IDG3_9CUCU|nr:hypothetical protein Zmor_012514 [Zophobas morio]